MSFLERISIVGDELSSPKKKRKCRCPDDDEDEDDEESLSSLEDRREALFAMMGSLWAASSSVGHPDPAYATAGIDANIAFPMSLVG